MGRQHRLDTGQRILGGAIIGGIGGAVLLGVGILRATLAQVGFTSEDTPWFALYVFTAALSGALGGVLLPLAKTKLGAVLVGIVAIQPFIAGGVYIAIDQPVSWTTRVFIWVITSCIFGPVVGLSWIRPWQTDP